MKIYLTFFSLLLLFIFNHAAGQSPQQFNYQAVARDASGDPLASKTLEMTTGIIQGSEDGSAVWSETQSVTTNEFGLFTLQIGKEEPLSVDWTDGPYYLNVQMNSGSGYIDMGTV